MWFLLIHPSAESCGVPRCRQSSALRRMICAACRVVDEAPQLQVCACSLPDKCDLMPECYTRLHRCDQDVSAIRNVMRCAMHASRRQRRVRAGSVAVTSWKLWLGPSRRRPGLGLADGRAHGALGARRLLRLARRRPGRRGARGGREPDEPPRETPRAGLVVGGSRQRSLSVLPHRFKLTGCAKNSL